MCVPVCQCTPPPPPGAGLTLAGLLLGGVGQQRGGEHVHAVLVEKAQELSLLRFL